MRTARFAVDAHLLEELGERLVARAHIALGELIKNSYDADAQTCSVQFLDDEIVIADDGTGMSKQDFLDHWMRLGTTHKVDEQTSPAGRPLTGSKGIGRLSVQFLARKMALETTSSAHPGETLRASVDWGDIVRGRDLQTVEVRWEIVDTLQEYPNQHPTGTRITLSDLKNTWTAEELEDLGREVWQLRSPFKSKPRGTRSPEHFEITVSAPGIEGGTAAFDHAWTALLSNWKARIRGRLDRGRSGQDAAISVEFVEGYPKSGNRPETYRETLSLPLPRESEHESPLIDRVEFDIFVFKPSGRQPAGVPVAELREYLAEFGNVSIYDSGFRLPYYGSGREAGGHDWLDMALDHSRRLTQSELLPEHLRSLQSPYMLDLPAPGRIFGAVDVNTNHERKIASRAKAGPGEWLQIQPGRDRLHDNAAYGQLRQLVRFSLDYYANRHRLRALRALEGGRSGEGAAQKYDRVVSVLDENQSRLPTPVYKQIRREAQDARKAAERQEEVLDQRAALLAPLATAGMLAFALAHELARETRLLASASSRLRRLARSGESSSIEGIADDFEAAHGRLDSLRDLFGQLSERDASSRPGVRMVVEGVSQAMSVLTPGVLYDLSGLDAGLRFPLGSIGEWSALLQNVLANAWNALLEAETKLVRFDSGRGKRREWLRVSDTGQGLGIPLSESDQLFEPFERRMEINPDNRSVALGGQGLGLAIVRMIAARRGADVRFVAPMEGFSTTFQISWAGGGR